jgi:hypothetical protein
VKQLVVFNRYEHKRKSLNEPLKTLISHSFADLGVQVKFVTAQDIDQVRGSICLLLVKPGSFQNNEAFHPSNKYFIWNLEPMSFSDCGYEKYDNLRKTFHGLLSSDKARNKVEHVFFFHSKQAEFFKGQRCSYLPIGYHECMTSSKPPVKDSSRILFLGGKTEYRTKFFRIVNAGAKGKSIIQVDDYQYRGFEHNKELIAKYMVGISHHGLEPKYNTHVLWHRIMSYAANKVVVLSQDLLDPCFINGQHYYHYRNHVDVAAVLDQAFKRAPEVSQNMLDLVRAKYYMPDLWKQSILLKYL